ncbi:MAG: FG-GAP repeat domain-containing protein, partial [Limisphaerales bacterium]
MKQTRQIRTVLKMRQLLLLLALLALCFGGALSAGAAIVEFDQTSDPAGILAQTNFLSTPTNVTTLTAPTSANGYHFVFWAINDVRANDAFGVAQNPASFTLLEPTVAIAHYIPESQDSDTNGLPDWFEISYFGSIGQDPNADPDGDGYTLAQEFAFGLNPLAWEPKPQDQYVDGGISEGRSAMVAINLQSLPTFTVRSVPDGLINTTTNIVTPGTAVSTPNLWGQNISGYRFAYWDVDGARQQDVSGVALGSVTYVVTTNTVATAHFILETDDTDANGLADWFEITYFGNLGQDPNADPDGDGYTIAQELALGLNPVAWEPKPQDEYVDGGISTARSAMVTINLQSLPTYTLLSSPDGLLDSTNIVSPGTLVTTPNLFGQSVSGYRFVYWDLDGVVQRNSSGVASGSINFVVTTNRVATAHYVLESDDTDNNGLADWFEIAYFGAVGQNPNADPDGDGYTIAQEFAMGLSPTSWEPKPQDEFVDGGISYARAANSTIMDMQPFERLQYGLVDGVVSNIFTGYGGVGGIIFGTNAAPALGDWDGDGDLDLFVALAPGGVRVFQNIGTKFTMNLSERTTNFAALSTAWSDIALPALALGDWSGDGKADLVVGGSSSTVRMVLSSGNFNPQSAPVVYSLATGSTNAIPALGDINGDGWVDL